MNVAGLTCGLALTAVVSVSQCRTTLQMSRSKDDDASSSVKFTVQEIRNLSSEHLQARLEREVHIATKGLADQQSEYRQELSHIDEEFADPSVQLCTIWDCSEPCSYDGFGF
jgi:hypothetical protein